jgi:carbonic anhydrase/acetyltransferase-like protein (isoleucine patch superfamily)
MDNCVIESNSIVAAGAVILKIGGRIWIDMGRSTGQSERY